MFKIARRWLLIFEFWKPEKMAKRAESDLAEQGPADEATEAAAEFGSLRLRGEQS